MDIKKALSDSRSKENTSRIVVFIGSDAKRFATLMDLFLHGTPRIAEHAAWPLSYCVEKYPRLITPYFGKLLKNATKPGNHDAIRRSTVRLLQYVNIPKKYQGEVADICFSFLQSKTEPIAVKVFSMSVLANLAKDNPELAGEIRILIEDQLPYGSAGFRSRAGKVLKQLDKL